MSEAAMTLTTVDVSQETTVEVGHSLWQDAVRRLFLLKMCDVIPDLLDNTL